MPDSNIDITCSDVTVTGGHVGEETILSGTLTVNSSVTSDIPDNMGKTLAVTSVFGNVIILDPNWAWKFHGRDSSYANDYKRHNKVAHAEISWPYNWSFTFTPDLPGQHLIALRGYATSQINTEVWPQSIELDYQAEYFVKVVDILPADLENQFEITIGDSVEYYDWDWPVIQEPVDQTGAVDGVALNVKIPAGTIILGTDHLEFNYDDQIIITPSAFFSEDPEVTIV